MVRPEALDAALAQASLDAALAQASLDAALAQASDENGLAEWYRDCVRPLLKMPEISWPRCCGHSCEPCSEQLKRVARRTLDLMRAD